MSERPRRRTDRILDPSYLDNLESVPTDELRDMRGDCEAFEAGLSYTRRLLQGKLDILRDELERRAAGGESGIEAILARLPGILADPNGGQSTPVRHTRILPPRVAENQRREVERLASEATLARIEALSSEELSQIVDGLTTAEAQASERRRRVQEVMDGIRAELVRRYKEGKEDPTALLTL